MSNRDKIRSLENRIKEFEHEGYDVSNLAKEVSQYQRWRLYYRLNEQIKEYASMIASLERDKFREVESGIIARIGLVTFGIIMVVNMLQFDTLRTVLNMGGKVLNMRITGYLFMMGFQLLCFILNRAWINKFLTDNWSENIYYTIFIYPVYLIFLGVRILGLVWSKSVSVLLVTFWLGGELALITGCFAAYLLWLIRVGSR